MAISGALLQDIANPKTIQVMDPVQRASQALQLQQAVESLKTAAVQREDIAAQIQDRQAIAQKRAQDAVKEQAAQARMEKNAQIIHDYIYEDPTNHSLQDDELTKRLAVNDPSFAEAHAKAYSGIANTKSEITNREGTLREIQGKNAFEQAQALLKQNRQNAEEKAGVMVPGTEFTTENQERAAQFRVLQDDGTYKNETRVIGKQGQLPRQSEPPLSPGRFQQEQTLAAQKAAQAAGNDPRLANVPTALHKDVLDKVQKVEDSYTAAKQAADDMQSFIDAMRAGNKQASAYIDTEGVLTLNTGRGVKRVNSAEISSYGNAGNIYDQIVAKIKKGTEGIGKSDSVLNDIESLHKTITQNAQKARDRGLQTIDNTYRSSFAGGGGSSLVRMVAPNGQEKDVPADQVEHYKSLGARVK